MDEVEELVVQVQNNNYQHIIFDLDETIAKLHLPWEKGFEMLYERAPVQVEGGLRQGFKHSEPFGVVLNRAVEQHEDFLPILLIWAQEFEAELTSQQPHHQLVSAIEEFASEGRRLIVWTSNTRRAAQQVLDELGIAHHFDVMVTRDDVRLLKPNPEGWQHIHDDEPLEQYLLIGDSANDRGAAEAVGIEFFEITYFKSPH